MLRFVDKKKCRANVTIFREAKKCIHLCDLHFLKDQWEPSENESWFVKNVLAGKKRLVKNLRLMYEWVEDEIDENSSVLANEVQYDIKLGLLL